MVSCASAGSPLTQILQVPSTASKRRPVALTGAREHLTDRVAGQFVTTGAGSIARRSEEADRAIRHSVL